jgi:thymidylate kinase
MAVIDRGGLFVAFEGIDGSGKSTTARRLVERMRSMGIGVTLVEHNGHELGHPAVSAYTADLLAMKRRTHTFEFGILGEPHWALIRASYYALVDRFVVQPALARGDVAVADGWYYKFLARLRANGSDVDPLAAVFATVRVPDVVLLLDTAPDLAALRKQDFNNSEFGTAPVRGSVRAAFAAYQRQVRHQLLRMAVTHRWQRIDSTGESPDEIAASALDRLGVSLASLAVREGAA